MKSVNSRLSIKVLLFEYEVREIQIHLAVSKTLIKILRVLGKRLCDRVRISGTCFNKKLIQHRVKYAKLRVSAGPYSCIFTL